MKKEKTIESRTADTILQQPEKIKVGDVVYEVAPPSLATLILASKYISQLPEEKMDPENIVLETLAVAEDCEAIGKVLAVLILGAKKAKATETKTIIKKRFFGLVRDKVTVEQSVVDNLAEVIREEMEPKQISDLISKILGQMQIAFFFGITTSLIEVNLLKKTKKETTASGQSSPE